MLALFSIIVGKKVEVSLRLFYFRLIGASNEIDRVSEFDNSLSFGAKQNALQQIIYALWIFKDYEKLKLIYNCVNVGNEEKKDNKNQKTKTNNVVPQPRLWTRRKKGKTTYYP